MLERVSHATLSVMVVWCFLVTGTPTARAQALCPDFGAPSFEVGLLRAPDSITVEVELRAFGATPPGGTWRTPISGGVASDGIALEGVSFTRSNEPRFGSTAQTYDVVVDLRAWGSLVTQLEIVVVDGDRLLRLGAFTDVALHCEAKSVARTFSITDRDFMSFFAGGRTPKLRVERTTGGC